MFYLPYGGRYHLKKLIDWVLEDILFHQILKRSIGQENKVVEKVLPLDLLNKVMFHWFEERWSFNGKWCYIGCKITFEKVIWVVSLKLLQHRRKSIGVKVIWSYEHFKGMYVDCNFFYIL